MCGVIKSVNVCGRGQQRRYFHINGVDALFVKPVYLVERDPAQRCLCRLAMVPMFTGERWYLWLILKNRPVDNFDDCKLVHGVRYERKLQSVLHMSRMEKKR